ncbi:MAG: hypothetical protein AAF513_01025 [Pseudomonadota bacterium]
MRIIEVLLRLGCALVAWMIVYTHCIWSATLDVVGCGPDADNLWRLLMGFAPFTVGFSLLLGVSARMPSVHSILAWAALPLVLFVPLAVRATWPWFVAATINGEPICTAEIAAWHPWWAPIQLAVLLWVSVIATRVFLRRHTILQS